MTLKGKECFNDRKCFPGSLFFFRSKSRDFYSWKYGKPRWAEIKIELTDGRKRNYMILAPYRSISFYFGSPLINPVLFITCYAEFSPSINVIEYLAVQIGPSICIPCLLRRHSRITQSHMSHRRRRVAASQSLRRSRHGIIY